MTRLAHWLLGACALAPIVAEAAIRPAPPPVNPITPPVVAVVPPIQPVSPTISTNLTINGYPTTPAAPALNSSPVVENGGGTVAGTSSGPPPPEAEHETPHAHLHHCEENAAYGTPDACEPPADPAPDRDHVSGWAVVLVLGVALLFMRWIYRRVRRG